VSIDKPTTEGRITMNTYRLTTGDLSYDISAPTKEQAIKEVDANHSMQWDVIKLKKVYGYKNTNSSKGDGKYYTFEPSDVIRAHVWFNLYGNPSYGLHLSNGSTFLLIDDYGAMNGLNHISRVNVLRRKDLV
jgi:hypothetical protein